MKWIRWRGLVAFVVIAAAVSVLWLFVIDRVIERYIEKAGTAMVGARVELDKADLSVFPLGLELTGLHVTDPSSPMRNAVEAARIAFLMDAMNLVMGKVTIDEMSVSGVRLNTPRAASGAIDKATAGRSAEKALISFSIPSVEDVLRKEDLESVRLAGEIQARIKADREMFAAALKAVPDQKKIKEYRDRLSQLKAKGKGGAAGMLAMAGEIATLRADIDRDATAIRTLANDAGKTVDYYKKSVELAAGAPSRDIKRLTEKYALTSQGLSNLSRVFFGGEIFAWVDKAIMWRARAERAAHVYKAYKGDEVEVKPRGRGADIIFFDADPTPSFLVRKAFVSVSVPSGDISGEVTDITGEQQVTGRPIRFRFAGDKLKGLDSMSLDGEIDRVSPGSPRYAARFDVRGYMIKDLALSQGSSMPLELKKGRADLTVKGEMSSDRIDAGLRAALTGLELSAGRPGETDVFLGAAAEAISGVRGFGFEAKVSGPFDAYGLDVSSDLDKVLMDSAGRVVAKKVAAFQAGLTERIKGQVSGRLSEMKADLSALDGIEKELGLRGGLIDGLMEEVTKDVTRGAPVKGIKIPGLPF